MRGPFAEDDQERLVTELGVLVFAVPAIAASVQAERYFGSASELDRFLYFDAQSLELGSVVNKTVLARLGTLEKLPWVKQLRPPTTGDVLPQALEGAAALMQARWW